LLIAYTLRKKQKPRRTKGFLVPERILLPSIWINVLLRSCVVSWSLRFAEPIVLPDGGKLTTLREAIAHLGKAIPKSDHEMPSVLTAAELLSLAAEHGGPVEFARIATLKAIDRHAQRLFTSNRKATHWGKRKLARDQ
jgi:hypothetical protein